MIKYFKKHKVLSVLGVIILSFFVLWAVLKIYLTLVIPAGVGERDYVSGVWEPDPRNLITIYMDMDRLKSIGVNTVSIGPFVYDLPLQKTLITLVTNRAHKKGLAVHIAPQAFGPGPFAPNPDMVEDKYIDRITKKSIEWAEFAEKYNVEYFSPLNEPDVVMGVDEANEWGKDILLPIREVYNGVVAMKIGHLRIDTAKDPLGLELTSSVRICEAGADECNDNIFKYHLGLVDSTGYDYLMVDLFPPDEFEGDDLLLFAREDTKALIGYYNQIAERSGNRGVIIGEFSVPYEKPEMMASIMPGAVVTSEMQGQFLDEYYSSLKPITKGVIHCGWVLRGYGIKDKPGEAIVEKHFAHD